jgi:hypothetical protein
MEEDCSSQMIFADVHYSGSHWDVHSEMVKLLEDHFSEIQSGVQGDSWIWIVDGGEKIVIDTFSSMTHQVKSRAAGSHVQKVIDVLRIKYDVQVFDAPSEEWG